MRGPKKFGDVVATGFLALVLAIVFVFVILYVLDTCVRFHFCSRADNWEVLVYLLWQLPINWLLLLLFPERSEPNDAEAT